MRRIEAAGLQYLELVTRLLQRIRLADPTGGIWEAADLQWWWRRDQHADPRSGVFWLDDEEPVAAAVVTDWGEVLGADVVALDDDVRLGVAWPALVERLGAVGDRRVEMAVNDGDAAMAAAAVTAGFALDGPDAMPCWLDAADVPAATPLPDGFELSDRARLAGRPHHMIRRSGADVAARLAECSLYRPDLDLAVVAPDDTIAAYGLFWADPVTGVGLVEPMRTEDAHQGLGLGRAVLTAGLQRLAAAGCARCKITYLTDNDVSRGLYLSAGFRPGPVDRSYAR